MQGQDSLTFVIKNAGIDVDGIFRSHSITQNFDSQNLDNSFFKARIDVNSIDTGIKARDKHLKKEKYFYAEEFSHIKFESTSILITPDGYLMKGNLSIKETTLPVEVPFSTTMVDGVEKFKGYLELDRRDYNVGKNHLIMGDLVKIYISVVNRNSL